MKPPSYLSTLLREYERRKKLNPSYSIRSYARYLGIHPSSLSNVLRQKRRLPDEVAHKIALKLVLSPKERARFVLSNSPQPMTEFSSKTDIQLTEEIHFKVISEWQYYALLSLIETENFRSDTKWISQRLGLSELKVHSILSDLRQLNLITTDNDNFKTNYLNLRTTEDIPSEALKRARREDLKLAEQTLDEVSVTLRDFSGSTLTVAQADIPELKKMIRDFRKKFMNKAENKPGNQVYKLGIQFFPVTKGNDSEN